MLLSASKNCKHCQTVLKQNQLDFCCTGCERVHNLILDGGFERYYKIKGNQTLKPVQNESQPFTYFNSKEFKDHYCQKMGEAYTATLVVEGLQCAACIWLIESFAQGFQGLQNVEIHFHKRHIRLEIDLSFNLESFARELANLGYHLRLPSEPTQDRSKDLLRLGIAGALAGNMMLFSVPFYAGLGTGFEAKLFGWINFLLAIPTLIYGGAPFFKRAWASIRQGALHLDIPIVLGISSAFGFSTWQLIGGNVHGLYFDSLGMLVFFLLLGRYIQHRMVQRAIEAAGRLSAELPELIKVKREDWIEVPAMTLRPGEIIEIRGGGVCPTDCRLEDPDATFNMQVVSGESKPIHRKKGETILAGSINLGRAIRAEVQKPCATSFVKQLTQWATEIREGKNQAEQQMAARWFLPVVLLCALLGCFYGATTVGLERGFIISLSIFIVACPCALALAQPLAQSFAMKSAANNGVWFKSFAPFEAPRFDKVYFDKTGVLTSGKPNIVSEKYFGPKPDSWYRAAVRDLEACSNHPLAQAFLYEDQIRQACKVGNVKILPGLGIKGVVDGEAIHLVGRKAMTELPELHSSSLPQQTSDTEILVFANGHCIGQILLDDPIRSQAKQVMNYLNMRKIDPIILSGDHQEAVSKTALAIGVKTHFGGLTPQEKNAMIKNPATSLMLGDGLNDLTALAKSAVAMVPSSASEAAIRLADVVYPAEKLSSLNQVLDLSERAKSTAKRSIRISFLYNCIAIGLCFTGWITPLIAAILMPLSSINVLLHSAWSLKKREI